MNRIIPISKLLQGAEARSIADIAGLYPGGIVVSEAFALMVARAHGYDLEGRKIVKKSDKSLDESQRPDRA